MTELVPKTVMLSNGIAMPTLGLGVYRMAEGHEAERAVTWALAAGYRLIDTAKLYGNEASVGRAVRASGVPREEVFVTTKLWPTDFLDPLGAFERSAAKLDLGHIDLYLVHFPIPYVPSKVWKTLERLYREGRVRSIGVSNYSISQLQKLLASCSIPPVVNQVRFSPFSYKRELLAFCASQNIVLEAHTPLAEGKRLDHRVVASIAAAHDKSPAQVFIRWALQHGTVVIPKSSRKERIEENLDVFGFALTQEEMAALDTL